MVKLGFVVVEFIFSSWRGGYTPPSKWIVLKIKELREEHFVNS